MAEAEEIQKILNIRVNYQEAVKGIEEYNRKIAEAKKYQDELNERLKAGEVSADEYAEGMATAQQRDPHAEQGDTEQHQGAGIAGRFPQADAGAALPDDQSLLRDEP